MRDLSLPARFMHGRICTNERGEINLHLRATTASLNERQNAEITLTHCERAGRTFELPTHPSIHPSPRGKKLPGLDSEHFKSSRKSSRNYSRKSSRKCSRLYCQKGSFLILSRHFQFNWHWMHLKNLHENLHENIGFQTCTNSSKV